MWSRLGLLCILFVLEGYFPGKTIETMRQRYGPPLSENFVVRSGIVVTATYAKDGHVCELLIAPQKPITPIKPADLTSKSIDSKLLTELIDELVPEKERGRGISGDLLNLMCLPSNDCAGSGSTWEKVSIYRNGGDNQEHYATIIWLDADCAPLPGQDTGKHQQPPGRTER
jgi:hypothetical protein